MRQSTLMASAMAAAPVLGSPVSAADWGPQTCCARSRQPDPVTRRSWCRAL